LGREERRKSEKVLKESNKQILKDIQKRQLEFENTNYTILEGTKVKLNVKQIKSRPDYIRMRDTYKEFVESNVDNIFTVEYDEKKKDEPILVCLMEDPSEVKWLFWVGDLFIVKEINEDIK